MATLRYEVGMTLIADREWPNADLEAALEMAIQREWGGLLVDRIRVRPVRATGTAPTAWADAVSRIRAALPHAVEDTSDAFFRVTAEARDGRGWVVGTWDGAAEWSIARYRHAFGWYTGVDGDVAPLMLEQDDRTFIADFLAEYAR